MRLGAIEAGGTKFVVAIGDENGNVLERDSFPTTTPQETVENIFKFFDGKDIEALGLGCFGPIDPDLKSPTYGYITTTPKPGWTNYNIVGALQEHYPDLPIGFDTDVNGAALGEAYFGAAKELDSALYLTIGTGIGGGAIVEGNLVHGLLHPEMGHMILEQREDDTYKGKCPYHGTCFEGLAAGPAIEERWGIKGSELPEDHPAWDLEAWYIAQALAIYVLTISPKKIILGIWARLTLIFWPLPPFRKRTSMMLEQEPSMSGRQTMINRKFSTNCLSFVAKEVKAVIPF